MIPQLKDNRMFERLRFQILVDYNNHRNRMTYDYCYDLSEGGLFIETLFPLEIDERIELNFSFPNSGEKLSLEAEVRWIRTKEGQEEGPRGMGISFVNVSSKARRLLNENLEIYKTYLETYK